MIKERINPNSIYLVLLAILLIVVSLLGFSFYKEDKQPFSDIRVVVENNGLSESINLYFDGSKLYCFLPAYADLDKVYLESDLNFKIDGNVYNSKTPLSNYSLNESHLIERNSIFVEKEEFVIMKAENLKTIFIDTETGKLDYLYEDKEYSESATMRLYDSFGQIEFKDKLKSISGRGNHSWQFDKRSWTITMNQDTSIFGMEAASKWVLLANMAEDTTGLRNMTALKLAKDIGLEYTSDICFVNLYLNDEYFGLYEIAEKIEQGENRMDIGDLDEDNINIVGNAYNNLTISEEYLEDGSFYTYSDFASPSNIKSGYVIERNYDYKWYTKPYRFKTKYGDCYNVREPSILNKEEMEYILNVVQNVEDALYSESYINKDSGKELSELIDVESFAKKYLVDEVTKNEGAGATSSYFYLKENDDKLYAGPVCDYDKSLGSVLVWNGTDGLTYSSWHTYSNADFWTSLYKYRPFYDKVVETYKEIAVSSMKGISDLYIDEWSNEIVESYVMDYYRWDNKFGFNMFADKDSILMYPAVLQYPKERLKEWIEGRLTFLNEVWIENKDYKTVLFINANNESKEYECDISGFVINEFPDLGYDMSIYEWIDTSSGQTVTCPIVVSDDMRLKIVKKETN